MAKDQSAFGKSIVAVAPFIRTRCRTLH